MNPTDTNFDGSETMQQTQLHGGGGALGGGENPLNTQRLVHVY